MLYCRWDFCPRTFTTLAEMGDHLKTDHIAREEPVFVPSHARERRPDGAWVLLEQTWSTLPSTISSFPASASFPTDSSILSFTGGSSNPASSFAVVPDDKVDFDAFLRSPTPNTSTSKPVNVILAPSHLGWGQPPSYPSPTRSSLPSNPTPSSATKSQPVSSAEGVPPPDDLPMPTQAVVGQRNEALQDTSVSAHRQSGNGVAFPWGEGE